MSRRRRAQKRVKLPDYKYNSITVTQFINFMMNSGKKRLAERLFYDAVDSLTEIEPKGGIIVFKKALENVKPSLEVKTRRVGGANYQVPIEVSQERAVALAMRWLIAAARNRSENTMAEKLSKEFAQAANNEGGAVRKRVETHKMAEANKAFAHFRW